ncbi:hypothetical protein D0T84_00605 [Dysgonomonas sp. 521]|uniref:virulence RhuM family protein n=1 Tax=Dysgonomonas sp. 521 TaxID=2302932 RepID=UPI0013D38725|nr:virulence RhuM family protein [Dysgonomonas sp. 521]NDV93418.1 hypothetical protein [Dysgonomonas sp. 521]
MKRELKIGESQLITITGEGTVTVPDKVRMTIDEIAGLLGIYYQEAKKCIRAIEKSGVAPGDYTLSGTVEGLNIYPDYYGLEMIIAVAFHVQSENTQVLRKWIVKHSVSPKLIDLPVSISRQWHEWN